MRGKSNGQNRFLRLITIPIRVLSRAKDLYVKSQTGCADRVSYGGGMLGVSSGPVPSVPRSFSVGSSYSGGSDSEDLRELIRAASARSSGVMDLYGKQQAEVAVRRSATVAVAGSRGVPRSCSVGMGRIDEDRACVFGEDDDLTKDPRKTEESPFIIRPRNPTAPQFLIYYPAI